MARPDEALRADLETLVDLESFAAVFSALHDIAKERGEKAPDNSRQRGAHLYLSDEIHKAHRVARNFGI